MPQSFACLHHHFIFSTKEREPLIRPEMQGRLFAMIGGILRTEGSTLVAAGGMPDHVHLLVALSREASVAGTMRLVKANTSRWVRTEFTPLRAFAWQSGYGAFAVSLSGVEAVCKYLANQTEHHRVMSFQEEYRSFLTRHGIAFEEEFLWD